MKMGIWIGATFAVALFSFTAQAAMLWSPAPVEKGHGGHDRSAGKSYLLEDGEGADIHLISPKLQSKEISATSGRVSVKAMGMDNYHALVAIRNIDHRHESAMRYVYMFGKPSKASPSDLMRHEKAALEIEPAPYAREHWRYHSGTDAQFIVRFKGEALADTDVIMTTSNGSSTTFTSDIEGRLTVPLPEDFSEIKQGRRANHASDFVLITEYRDGADSFISSLTSEYHVNPKHWQSTSLGIAVIGGGLLLGGLITWRSRRRKEK